LEFFALEIGAFGLATDNWYVFVSQKPSISQYSWKSFNCKL